MTNKIINIFTNETDISLETKSELTKILVDKGYTVTEESRDNADLIICIGGDGAFLETIHSCKFPQSPIIGINTGHLGFFQEISPDCLEQFIKDYENGQYSIQDLSTVEATVTLLDGRSNMHLGLNEIIIKGRQSYAIHFGLSIDGKPLERFSGDGILVATSSGSTAYNYSLGGSIVDPRLDLLQVTPIAPMNTTAYRSFTSSILLPAEISLEIFPEQEDNRIFILNDGIETGYSNVKDIKVEVSDTMVHLMRFKNYDFWNKVKTKFL
ncbi:MAG: NAD(+)/NADH kinase [Bacillota bacterium]|nr:NAD(+)/NADH kinase [Bacillota bacterium]